MIWIILFVLFLVLAIVSYVKDDESLCDTFSGASTLFGIVLLVVFVIGLLAYPYLKGDYTKITVLNKRIHDVRNAYYRENYYSKNRMITGSMENIKQSTNLSKAVETLAEKESEYQSDLAIYKVCKEEFIYRFFTIGFFISDRIYELPELEINPLFKERL